MRNTHLIKDRLRGEAKRARADEARKILGDDFVIVPVVSWNRDVEKHKRLVALCERYKEALEEISNRPDYDTAKIAQQALEDQ